MSRLVVQGTPRRLDEVIRPFVRVLQLLLGGIPTLILLWFEAWWWAPVPLVLSFLAYEAFFALRADRPVIVEFTPERITLRDPTLGSTRAVDLDADPVAGRSLGSVEEAVDPSSSGSTGFDIPLRALPHSEDHPSLPADGPRDLVAGRVLGSVEEAVDPSTSGSTGFDIPLRALPHSRGPSVASRRWTSEIFAATLLHRPVSDDHRLTECVVALSARDEVLLVLSLRVSASGFQPRPEDVDVGALDGVLGGIAGLVRAVGPQDRACRQVLRDDRVVDWLRAHLPPKTRSRAAVRLWRGREPTLDLFGYHTDPPSAVLLLDPTDSGSLLALRPGRGVQQVQARTCPGVIRSVGRAQRSVVLFAADGGRGAQLAYELPLLVLELEHLGQVAIPAPHVDGSLPEVDLDDQAWHLHAPEGAVLLWHLGRHADVSLLPPAIRAVLPSSAEPTDVHDARESVPPGP